MKFTIDKNILQESLFHLSKIVPTRSTMPILNCILFSVSGNRLIIKSTNLDTYISSEIDIIITKFDKYALRILNELCIKY